jgi:hypothetical protein
MSGEAAYCPKCAGGDELAGDAIAAANIMPETALEASLLDLLNRTVDLNTQLLSESTRDLSQAKMHLLEDVLASVTSTWPDARAAQLSVVDWLRFTIEHRHLVAEMHALATGASP